VADATRVRDSEPMVKTAAASISAGEIHQMANGLAAYRNSANGATSGDSTKWETSGIVTVTKKSGVVILDGAPLWWDHSANEATCVPLVGDRDFFLGTAALNGTDEASAAITVACDLNVKPRYSAWLGDGHVWTNEATLGLGTTPLLGGGFQMAFDAVAEVAQVANYTEWSCLTTANGIFESRVAIFDIGDAAALDIDFGWATGSHASDFESIAVFAAFHLDGNALLAYVHSDDATTDVAPVSTTITLVDNTYHWFVIDTRDTAGVKFYIDGVRCNVATTFTWAAASGSVRPVFMMEKTSDDTTADVRVAFAGVRIAEQ
jgi:predicted RecA/RadA family phage recombinase